MHDNRYVRWQGLAMTQLSVAVALISGLSIAGMGAGLSLLQADKFVLVGWWKSIFAFSQVFLIAAVFLSTGAVITRLLDFRLTARSVRKEEQPSYERSPMIFGCGSEAYGRATWRLFWLSCILLALGFLLLCVSIVTAFKDKLY